jgi:hypothetical protein
MKNGKALILTALVAMASVFMLGNFVMRCYRSAGTSLEWTVPSVELRGAVLTAGQERRLIATHDGTTWVLSTGDVCAQLEIAGLVPEYKQMELIVTQEASYDRCIKAGHPVDRCSIAAQAWADRVTISSRAPRWPRSPRGDQWPKYKPSRGSTARLELRIMDESPEEAQLRELFDKVKDVCLNEGGRH